LLDRAQDIHSYKISTFELTGLAEGLDDGALLGPEDGNLDGDALGLDDNNALGLAVGLLIGEADGDFDGVDDGDFDGDVAEGVWLGLANLEFMLGFTEGVEFAFIGLIEGEEVLVGLSV
jgi:hypothetical protein